MVKDRSSRGMRKEQRNNGAPKITERNHRSPLESVTLYYRVFQFREKGEKKVRDPL